MAHHGPPQPPPPTEYDPNDPAIALDRDGNPCRKWIEDGDAAAGRPRRIITSPSPSSSSRSESSDDGGDSRSGPGHPGSRSSSSHYEHEGEASYSAVRHGRAGPFPFHNRIVAPYPAVMTFPVPGGEAHVHLLAGGAPAPSPTPPSGSGAVLSRHSTSLIVNAHVNSPGNAFNLHVHHHL